MEHAKAEIRLAGSSDNTVIKPRISAAEAVVLRAIHGPATFVSVTRAGSAEVSQADERERLSKIYDNELLAKLFPGAMSQIPVTLADAGLTVADEPEKTSKKGK